MLILVAGYSSCFLFHFKHSAIYVPLKSAAIETLKKERKEEGGGGEGINDKKAAPQTLPVIISRVRRQLGSSCFSLMGLISGTWHHNRLMETSVPPLRGR